MRQWCIHNPRKRKTERRIGAFITGWLAEEQDRGGRSGRAERTTPPPATPVSTPESRKEVDNKMADGISALHAANPRLAKMLQSAWRSSAAVHESEAVA